MKRLGRACAVAGPALALAAAVAALLSGKGVRWGFWDFRAGFSILRWAAYGGLAAAAVSGWGLWWSLAPEGVGVFPAAVGLAVGLGAFAVPWNLYRAARRFPPIHDVTTDPDHPPEFVKILPLRAGAPNPADYGGPAVAASQREAYPDLGPALLALWPAQAYARALAAAKSLGWEIVDADEKAGRLEATDTTRWFGFKDDVVVRVTPIGNGARVDVRSVSRVGKGDAGTNAARIRKFLALVTPHP